MSASNMMQHGRSTGYAATTIQKIALITGIVFLVIGIGGFIPGLTHGADHLSAAGADSGAHLLGVFQVSVLHNVVHLAYGVAGVAVAARASASRMYLIWGGAVYFLVWLYGLFAVGNDQLNFLPVNDADNWLHLGLALAMVLLGVFVDRTPRPGRATRR